MVEVAYENSMMVVAPVMQAAAASINVSSGEARGVFDIWSTVRDVDPCIQEVLCPWYSGVRYFFW